MFVERLNDIGPFGHLISYHKSQRRGELGRLAIFIYSIFCLCSTSPTAAIAQDADERPALPFPPGVSVESQCGDVNNLQDVELYDGSLGVSTDYVQTNEPSTLQFQWMNEASIRNRLPDHFPGNVSGARWCTGTLIANSLVLTAGHCFEVQNKYGWTSPYKRGANQEKIYAEPSVIATLFVANFGYQINKETGQIRKPSVYPVTRLIELERGNLDYSIVELGPDAEGKMPGDHVASAPLSQQPAHAGDVLGVIQHPQGEPKKIEAGKLLKLDGDKLLYDDIDTWGGSSGAGIRDANGKLIGVHTHAGCTSTARGSEGANKGVNLQSIFAVSDQI